MTLAVGVDLGATNLRAALVDTQPRGAEPPRLVHEARAELGAERSPAAVADRLAVAVTDVCRAAGVDAGTSAIGVGVAGMLRGSTGIVANAPNLGWREVDFRGLCRQRLPGRNIELYNDLNAIAFGEFTFGAGRGARDILCVYVGSGVGAGLVAGGRLVEGDSNVSGEIGHVKVVPPGAPGRECGCGARGCIEAYVGGHRLQERARAELGAGARSRAVELAGGRPERVHPGHLDAAAAAGDPYATALLDEVSPLLGLVLANAVTLLNPGRLILGGGVWMGAPELRRRVLAAYRAVVNGPSGEACSVVDAALADEAGILGAACLAALA